MEYNGRHYDIKCECGELMVLKPIPESEPIDWENNPVDLECPKCKEWYALYESELEIFEQAMKP